MHLIRPTLHVEPRTPPQLTSLSSITYPRLLMGYFGRYSMASLDEQRCQQSVQQLACSLFKRTSVQRAIPAAFSQESG